MLRDIERKVLRILCNFPHSNHRPPMFRELSAKTGKKENELRYILKQLQDNGFIFWDGEDTQTIQIIRGWEKEQPAPKVTTDYTRFMT